MHAIYRSKSCPEKKEFVVLAALIRPVAVICGLTLTTLPALAAPAHHFRNVQVSRDTFAAHSEPAIAENPAHHQNLIAGSKLFSDPAHYQFKIGTFYSTDGGRAWQDNGLLPGFADYAVTSDISFAFSKRGVAYACVLAASGKRSGIFVSRSTTGGRTWSKPFPVFLDTTGTTFSDKPWIAVDRSKTASAGTVYVSWNLDGNTDGAHDPDTIKGQIMDAPGSTPGVVIAKSTDGGRTWSSPVLIHDFNRGDAIGAIPAVGPQGQVAVAYSVFDSNGDNVDRISVARSHDGGATWSIASIKPVHGIPGHIGPSTFRNITMPAFAVSPHDGSMVVVWADEAAHDADISSSTSLDGGITWSSPVRVNHDHLGNGRDQFQPTLAVSANGTYTSSWFDRRRDPQNRLIDVYLAQSDDDGASFGHNYRVTAHSWDPAIDAPLPEGKPGNTFIGDYQALAVDNTTVHPLWNDTQDTRSQQIRTAVLPESRLQ